MSTTLKMLVEKAHFYYDAMEKSKSTFLQLWSASSNLHVLEQLLDQYNSEPKHKYEARNPEHTNDQAIAEMINLVLTQGITKSPDDVKPMKVAITDIDDNGIVHMLLKILDNCAQAQIGDLSIARARQNLGALCKAYKDRLVHVDAELQFLADANSLLNEIELQQKAAKEQQLRLQQAEKFAHEEELNRLSLKHNLEMQIAANTIDELHLDIVELNSMGVNLADEAEADMDQYSSELSQAKATISELTAQSEAVLFRYKEGVVRLEKQSREYGQVLEQQIQSQQAVQKAEAELAAMLRVKYDLESNLREARDLSSVQNMERVALVKMFDVSTLEKRGLEKDIDKLRVKFHEQGEVLLTTKKSLAATETLLMNNNALMCQLTLDLKAAQEELQAAVADKAQVAPQLAELTEQLAQRDANIATLDRTIKELTAKVKELSADAIKLKAAKKEAQDAQERAVKLSGKSQDQIATYLKTIADGNMTIQQLNAKVALLEEQVFELSADEKPHLEKAEGVKPATSKRQITLRTVPQDDAERIKDGYLNPIPTTVGQSPHSTFNNDDSSKRKLRMTKSPQIAPVASTTSNRRP